MTTPTSDETTPAERAYAMAALDAVAAHEAMEAAQLAALLADGVLQERAAAVHPSRYQPYSEADRQYLRSEFMRLSGA